MLTNIAMKYYATIKNEKRGTRPAKKGGDENLEIELTKKGLLEYEIVYSDQGLRVMNNAVVILQTGELSKV